MFTTKFWAATAERAIKGAAATLLAVFTVAGASVLNADWPQALAAAGTSALVSVLFSIGSAAATGGGPSLTNSEQLTPPVD